MPSLVPVPHPHTVIFLHIPKTAGSTLHAIFDRRVRRADRYGIFAADYADAEVGDLTSLPEEERRAIKLLKGHQPFGLHEFLPQPCVYVTMLREPVARAISQYFYILKNPHHRLHEQVKKMRSAGEFIESGISLGVNNGQVRWLLGELHSLGYGDVGQVHLEQVKKNIEDRFALVGLTERFDASVLLLQRVMQWRWPPFYRSYNVNRRKNAVDDEQKEIIRDYNRLDIELYEYANATLDVMLDQAALDSRSVERFRSLNRLYSRARWPQDSVPLGVRKLKRYLTTSRKETALRKGGNAEI